MEKVQLILAIHNHQPVGNFDSIFEQAVDRCYLPFLQVLERHPNIHIGLHYSGCLFEWMEDHKPHLLDKLAKLHERGQVELLGGGFFEPMLSELPKPDAVGQIEMMREYLAKRFGAKSEGIWLTERVWEPELSVLLNQADVRYTLVDDTHFYYSGMKPERLFGYYVTEKAGSPLAIFGIDKQVRYSIPFKPVAQVISELTKEVAAIPRGIVYGDDGEKFGIWPGTHDWVFKEGWLEEFFYALEKSDVIDVLSPGTFLNRYPPTGRIYLPTASYEEMLTWAMPAESIHRYEDLTHELQRQGLWEKVRPFFRGGIWQNFFTKYSEANHMHKRMVLVSKKFSEACESVGRWTDDLEQARRALYRGQCNCAYWHGLFGGLYLPHLRDAVYRELIRAETILDQIIQGDEAWIAYDQRDFNCDFEDEVIVENAVLNAYIDPNHGGVVTEIDYRPAHFNLLNVLTRRVEGYHRHLHGSPPADTGTEVSTQPTSIHELAHKHDPALEKKVTADNHTRCSFLDRFPQAGVQWEDLASGGYQEEGDFLDGRYQVERLGVDEDGDCDFELLLSRAGHLKRAGNEYPLVLEKHMTIPVDRPELRVRYVLRNPSNSPLDLCFCPELNITLLGGDDPLRVFEYNGMDGPGPTLRTSGQTDEVSWFALVNRFENFRILLSFDPPTSLMRHPVETVSQSERGFELTYQGSAIIPKWEITIPPKMSFSISILLTIEPLEESGELLESKDQ